MFNPFEKKPTSTPKEEIKKTADNLSNLEDYKDKINDPDLIKSLERKGEQLNKIITKLETASGLDRNEILKAYKEMAESPGQINDVISAGIKEASEEVKKTGSLEAVLLWLKDNAESKKALAFASALAVLMIGDGATNSANAGRINLSEPLTGNIKRSPVKINEVELDTRFGGEELEEINTRNENSATKQPSVPSNFEIENTSQIGGGVEKAPGAKVYINKIVVIDGIEYEIPGK